jgi:hypothetical protein
LFLQTLHDFGVRKLAIIGVAPIGCTPNATAYYGTNGSLCVEKLNKAAILFNQLLKLRVQDLNNKLIGANFIYLEIYEIIWKYLNVLGKSVFYSINFIHDEFVYFLKFFYLYVF